MGDEFRFDGHSYETLAAAGIRWQDVVYVLWASPGVRHHIGFVLRIAAQSGDGRWLAVACVGEEDDDYLVVGARHLDDAEAVVVRA
jgi:hypothetical protein